ncbi:queuine tRNA-ribosyltransferase catalytic subunit [Enteropsectra breve]|nr:queuine tRNA-ribosyltransferase catalytic subunit [Enteropsectra breve]
MFTDYKIIKKCSTTNARVSEYELSNNTIHLPIFMPVATYGAMRAADTKHLEEEIILSNTYHLRDLGRNVKDFIGWKKGMLTDSGGFQIQSLPDVKVTDDGVIFGGKLFTPEDSMDVQMMLGADIMMQLDDVVNPMEPRELHVRAIERSVEWLDRAILHINETQSKSSEQEMEVNSQEMEINSEKKKIKLSEVPQIQCHKGQVIFPIVQGGLCDDLRKLSIEAILKRGPKGLAIGGLSGGEDKDDFCRTVKFCCDNLPDALPRYVMGIGYPEDIVVCCALGTDMSDCVYPTRTARFGRAFRDTGDTVVDNRVYKEANGPIDGECGCKTCKKYTKAYLAAIKGTSIYCMLLTEHNMFYMRNLTRRIREAVLIDKYPDFVKTYMKMRYGEKIPEWIARAMETVKVIL